MIPLLDSLDDTCCNNKYNVIEKSIPLLITDNDKDTDTDKDKKRKKQTIPKHVRKLVWNTYIGDDIIKHKCLCCKKTTIENTFFECGHVVSEKCGGTLEMSNLRPICSQCNKSMGALNMVDYVKMYGLYIG